MPFNPVGAALKSGHVTGRIVNLKFILNIPHTDDRAYRIH
jgi:hypothetical protein